MHTASHGYSCASSVQKGNVLYKKAPERRRRYENCIIEITKRKMKGDRNYTFDGYHYNEVEKVNTKTLT